MLIFRLVMYLASAAAACIVVALDYVAYDKRTRRFRSLRRALIALTAVSALGGVAVTIVDDKAKKLKIAELHDALARTSVELKHTQEELRHASDAVTGGTSFPYLNIVGGRLLLVNEGPDPLYDLSIRMWAPKEYAKNLTDAQWQALERRAYHVNIATHPPRAVRDLGPFSLPKGASVKSLVATIVARNGSFSEQILLRRVAGRWATAYRVFRGQDSNQAAKLLERSDTMLRDERGEVSWEDVR